MHWVWKNFFSDIQNPSGKDIFRGFATSPYPLFKRTFELYVLRRKHISSDAWTTSTFVKNYEQGSILTLTSGSTYALTDWRKKYFSDWIKKNGMARY